MILCALDQSFCTSLEVPLPQPLPFFLPIHSHHAPRWHITPAFAFLSICFPFLSFYSSYTPLDPFPHPLSLFLFHLLSWAKPRNSLHTNSNYDDDDADAAAADDDDYYSARHFFIFLIIPKNVFHVSHSLSNNGVYPRLDIGQVWDDMQSWKLNANIFSFPFSLLTPTARLHCSTIFCPFPLQM